MAKDRKTTKEQRDDLRRLLAAWAPYAPSTHRDLDQASHKALPALLDDLDEAERFLAESAEVVAESKAAYEHVVAERDALREGCQVAVNNQHVYLTALRERDEARAEVEQLKLERPLFSRRQLQAAAQHLVEALDNRDGHAFMHRDAGLQGRFRALRDLLSPVRPSAAARGLTDAHEFGSEWIPPRPPTASPSTAEANPRCEVDGCNSFAAGHETARMCWTHEGNWIDDAAYHRGYREGVETAQRFLREHADGYEHGQAGSVIANVLREKAGGLGDLTRPTTETGR